MRKIFYTLVLCGFLSPALALELGYTGTFSKTELNTSLAFSTSAPLQASSLQYDPYYDGFDDFRFSRRIRRFHGGGFGGGFGYYDPYFTNDVYFAIARNQLTRDKRNICYRFARYLTFQIDALL